MSLTAELAQKIWENNNEHTATNIGRLGNCAHCEQPFNRYDKYLTLYEYGKYPTHRGCCMDAAGIKGAYDEARRVSFLPPPEQSKPAAEATPVPVFQDRRANRDNEVEWLRNQNEQLMQLLTHLVTQGR